MKLPLFVTHKNKYFIGAIVYAVTYLMYYVTNHFPILEPRLLPMTWIDQDTPFLPWTLPVYISEYFYFAFVYILLNHEDNINQYLYSFLATQIIACTIFIVYPVTYPRELYPVPSDIPLWLQKTWIWLRKQDAPTNCLPSLHVASVFLSAFAFITDRKMNKFWVFFAWSTAISITTLTTKQHYFVDIISGYALAVASYIWFHHQQKYFRLR